MLSVGYNFLVNYLNGSNREFFNNLTQENIDIYNPVHNSSIQKLNSIVEKFSLNKSEETLLILHILNETNKYFNEIFHDLGGLSNDLIHDIFKANHINEKFEIRYYLLNKFIFEKSGKLKHYIFVYLEDYYVFQENTGVFQYSKNSNFYKLKDLNGHFVFTGNYGIGRKKTFVALSCFNNKPYFFINSKETAYETAFFAVVSNAYLCVTQYEFLDEIIDFLPYIKFLAVISDVKKEYTGLFSIDFPDLTFEERKQYWQKTDFILEDLSVASQYIFSPKEIDEILEDAELYRKINNENIITVKNITEIMHRKLKSKGQNNFQDKQIIYSLSDVILPIKQKNTLYEAVAQAKNKEKVIANHKLSEIFQYGIGLSILLVGGAGTGKTMTAFAFANELNALIYKIDLSMVVSKFIGETEKNLKKIFQEAKNTQALLFFDEADALFSKRTEVKDSNDKYSNMEAAFLLQEIENYDGVTILATNFLQNIDESFKRRMKFIIEFPYPTPEDRLQIFQENIPKTLLLNENVDFEFLATNFELTGANIKNIIYNSIFLATENNNVLDMKLLIKSTITEFEKIGKYLSIKDFGAYAQLFEETI